MVTQKIIINSPVGLHLHPATLFAKYSLKYPRLKVWIENAEGRRVYVSLLAVLAMDIQERDTITIICEGYCEKEAIEDFVRLNEEGYPDDFWDRYPWKEGRKEKK